MKILNSELQREGKKLRRIQTQASILDRNWLLSSPDDLMELQAYALNKRERDLEHIKWQTYIYIWRRLQSFARSSDDVKRDETFDEPQVAGRTAAIFSEQASLRVRTTSSLTLMMCFFCNRCRWTTTC